MHQTLKSLRETLLECAAMNFRAVFSVFFDDPLVASKVKLPPGVFEDVLEKGKDIHFLIHFRHLKKLFSYRDLLRWENFDIEINRTSTDRAGNDRFLKRMNKVQYPIRTLRIRCYEMSQEGMEQLCAMGSTIECLSILYYTRSAPIFLNASFPKLRRLFISVDPDSFRPDTSLVIDLHQFSDTLEELMVAFEQVDDSFINSLTSLKKLSVLSLQNTKPSFPSSYEFKSTAFEKIGSMSHLRSLDLRYVYVNETSFNTFSTMLMKLTNLKKLDLSFFEYSDPKLEILKSLLQNKNLEKLGLIISVGDDCNELLADQVLTLHPGSILTSITAYIHSNGEHYNRLIDILLERLHLFQSHEMEIVENILLDSLEESNTIDYVLQYIRTGRCSQDFIMKLMHVLCSETDFNFQNEIWNAADEFYLQIFDEAQVVRCILEYFKQNLNRNFSARLKRYLFFTCFYKSNERRAMYYNIRCYVRALESNLFGDEINTSFKQAISESMKFIEECC